MADPTTYGDALAVLDRFGGIGMYPTAVVEALGEGVNGIRTDTPKAGSAGLARTTTMIVGAARDAIEGARREAEARGTTSTLKRHR